MTPELVMRLICAVVFIACFFLVSGFFSNGNSGQGGTHE